MARCSLVPAFDSRDPEHGGDLGVGEAGEELERDQLALARRRARRARRRARRRALALLDALVGGGARDVGRVRRQLGLAAAAAQLVEGGVAGDPEEPGARLAAAGVEAGALAVGALEGGRGDLLGGRRGRAAGRPRRRRRRRGSSGRGCRRRCRPRSGRSCGGCEQRLTHAPTTGGPRSITAASMRAQAACGSCSASVSGRAGSRRRRPGGVDRLAR